MKKKKLFIVIIIFIIAIFIVSKFRSVYSIKYQIKDSKNKYNIIEKFQKKTDFNNSNYYFEIKVNDSQFNFQLYYKFNDKRVIKKIYYYKDEINECLLPIFKDSQQLIDMICIDDDEYIYYQSIVGQNKKLDKYISGIKEYDIKKYSDKETQKNKNIVLNKMDSNYYYLLENYKGVYIINSGKIKYDIKLFSTDVYKKPIKYFINKYFLIADYNEKYEFNKFYLIDITTGKQQIIESSYAISMDSYIQGVVDDIIYLFDTSNKKQYKINYKKKTVELFNNDKVMIYQENKWKEENIYTAINGEVKFNDYRIESSKYEIIDIIGNYKYCYKKVNDKYIVYKDNVQKTGNKIKILTINNLNRIYYNEEKLYYIQDGYLRMYSDLNGIKTVLYSRELEFNDDLLVGFYQIH